MVSVGGMEMGGKGRQFQSGAAFLLKRPSKYDVITRTIEPGWEVEFKNGQDVVVARHELPLTQKEVLSEGNRVIQKALDLYSLKFHDSHKTKPVLLERLLFYRKGERFIFEITDNAEMKLSMGPVKITAYDKDGKEVPPIKQEMVWNTAYRYYRLSQNSDDIYEACRYLWLAFESLLSEVVPIEKNEHEGDFIKRAIKQLGASIDIAAILQPGNSDYISHVMNELYEKFRLPLFHSKDKGGSHQVIPFDIYDPTELAEKYRKLLKLWQELVIKHIGPIGGSSSFSRAILQEGMKPLAESLTNGFICIDNTPISDDEVEASPGGCPLHKFFLVKGEKQENGTFNIYAVMTEPETVGDAVFYRFGLQEGDSTKFVNHFENGFQIDGCDQFKFTFQLAMVSVNAPKTNF